MHTIREALPAKKYTCDLLLKVELSAAAYEIHQRINTVDPSGATQPPKLGSPKGAPGGAGESSFNSFARIEDNNSDKWSGATWAAKGSSENFGGRTNSIYFQFGNYVSKENYSLFFEPIGVNLSIVVVENCPPILGRFSSKYCIRLFSCERLFPSIASSY